MKNSEKSNSEVSLSEAARQLDSSRTRLRSLIRDGLLSSRKVANREMVCLDAVREALEAVHPESAGDGNFRERWASQFDRVVSEFGSGLVFSNADIKDTLLELHRCCYPDTPHYSELYRRKRIRMEGDVKGVLWPKTPQDGREQWDLAGKWTITLVTCSEVEDLEVLSSFDPVLLVRTLKAIIPVKIQHTSESEPHFFILVFRAEPPYYCREVAVARTPIHSPQELETSALLKQYFTDIRKDDYDSDRWYRVRLLNTYDAVSGHIQLRLNLLRFWAAWPSLERRYTSARKRSYLGNVAEVIPGLHPTARRKSEELRDGNKMGRREYGVLRREVLDVNSAEKIIGVDDLDGLYMERPVEDQNFIRPNDVLIDLYAPWRRSVVAECPESVLVPNGLVLLRSRSGNRQADRDYQAEFAEIYKCAFEENLQDFRRRLSSDSGCILESNDLGHLQEIQDESMSYFDMYWYFLRRREPIGMILSVQAILEMPIPADREDNGGDVILSL